MYFHQLTRRGNALHDRAREQAGCLRRQYHCSYSSSSSALAKDCYTRGISTESLDKLVDRSRIVEKAVAIPRCSPGPIAKPKPYPKAHNCRSDQSPLDLRRIRTYPIYNVSISRFRSNNVACSIPIVDGHHYHVASRCKVASIKDRIRSTTTQESASVDPEHHRSE